LQQRKRGRRVVEVDLPPLEQLAQRVRERVEVDLEPDGERGRGADPRTHAAVLGAGDRLVEVKLAAPEVLVAEGVEAEDLLPLLAELLGVGLDGLVEALGHRIPPVGGKDPSGLDQDEQAKRKAHADESVHAACVNVRKTCVLRHYGSSPLMELRTSRSFPGNLSGCSPLHPRRGGASWCCRRSVESPRPTRMRRPMTSWWLASCPPTPPPSPPSS